MGKPLATLDIEISTTDKTLTLTESIGTKKTELLTADIVSGCDKTGTPAGNYKGGKWIKDKTNPTHGKDPLVEGQLGQPLWPVLLAPE